MKVQGRDNVRTMRTSALVSYRGKLADAEAKVSDKWVSLLIENGYGTWRPTDKEPPLTGKDLEYFRKWKGESDRYNAEIRWIDQDLLGRRR